MKMLFAALFLSSLAIGQTTIFGLTLGKPAPQIPGCGRIHQEDPAPVCLDAPSFLYSRGTDLIHFDEVDGVVQHVSVSWLPGFCDQARTGLDEKFGNPSAIQKKSVQNGFGGTAQETDEAWVRKDGSRIIWSKPGTQLNNCSLEVSTQEWLAKEKARNKSEL
jgi:hypothetical protein